MFKAFENSMILIIGIKRVISISKIKKIIAIKKNCKEKGIRALVLGSNPHSKGEFFSLSENVFFDNKLIIITKTIIIKIVIIKIKIVDWIIYTRNRFFDWKSTIMIILCKYLPHQ